MTITQAILVNRIRWHLGDNVWETTGTASSASSVIAVLDGTDWSEGDIGELLDVTTGVVENFFVLSISANNLTVVRGYYGTTAATHSSTSRIFKNPKFRNIEITNAISEVIESELPWPKFYKVTADTITPAPTTTTWYDLAADALALVRVTQAYGTSNLRQQVYGERRLYNRIAFRRGLQAGIAASTVGISFIDGFRHSSNTVAVDYAAKITDTVSSAIYQDFSAGEAITSAIEYGAVALLQGSLELRKPRQSAEETDNLRASMFFERLFRRALATAQKELRQKNPLMHGWDASA
jgi:hypothetical protein